MLVDRIAGGVPVWTSRSKLVRRPDSAGASSIVLGGLPGSPPRTGSIFPELGPGRPREASVALPRRTAALPVCDRGQQSLTPEPLDAESRPARRELLVLSHAEVVIARGEDVQLGRDAGPLQSQVHDRAVLGGGAAVALPVVGGVGQEDRGRVGRDDEVRPDLVLVLLLQVARVARDGEIGPGTDLVDGVDRLIQPLARSSWRSRAPGVRPPRSRPCRSASGRCPTPRPGCGPGGRPAGRRAAGRAAARPWRHRDAAGSGT